MLTKNVPFDLICIINPQFFPEKGIPKRGGGEGGGTVFWEKSSMLPYFFGLTPYLYGMYSPNHMVIPSANMLHMLDYAM